MLSDGVSKKKTDLRLELKKEPNVFKNRDLGGFQALSVLKGLSG